MAIGSALGLAGLGHVFLRLGGLFALLGVPCLGFALLRPLGHRLALGIGSPFIGSPIGMGFFAAFWSCSSAFA